MATPVNICNQALGHLSAGSITAIGESTPQGEACALYYESARDGTLEISDWKFAKKYATLTLTLPVSWEFEYCFKLPDDFLTLREVDGIQADNFRYDIAGNAIYLDTNEPNIKYTARVAEGLFTPFFALVMGYHMASLMCYKLTKDKVLKRDLERQFSSYLSEAQIVNIAQRGQRQVMPASRLDSVR